MVMERSDYAKQRSEPALVPEWLKGTQNGVIGNGGSLGYHFASSSQSDRTSSSYLRRSSSTNGSLMPDKDPSISSWSHASFSRSHRDREWEKGLDFRSVDSRDREYSDSFSPTNIVTSRIEKDCSRRSQPSVQGKQGAVRPKKVGSDAKNGLNAGGIVVNSIHKAAFDRDFPTLGAEEKQGVPGIARVSSPGLSTASQSLLMGALPAIGGDGWNSALAELPATVGSSSTLLSPGQQTTAVTSGAVLPNNSSGLNMAETLAQPPARARAVAPVSVETQKLEELTIKQFRQLIPMTPSMPKNLVLNSSEKAKTKGARTSELSSVKGGQQHLSSQLIGNMRGSARSDTTKTSQIGKLHPLKGSRESNGVFSATRDVSSLTNANRPSHGALRNPSNAKLASDVKVVSSTFTNGSLDRKLLPQVQNRIDFFNSLRKKTSVNLSTVTSDSSPIGSSVPEKSDGQIIGVANPINNINDISCSVSGIESPQYSTENGTSIADDGDVCQESEMYSDEGEQSSGSYVDMIPDEEAAFLRRLGWEENAKYEALTEEEISAFFNEHKEKKPASKLCQKMQQAKIVPLGSCLGGIAGSSPGLNTYNASCEE